MNAEFARRDAHKRPDDVRKYITDRLKEVSGKCASELFIRDAEDLLQLTGMALGKSSRTNS